MVDVVSECFQDGVLLRREAQALGIDDNVLYRAVRAGVITRVRQGAYVEPDVWRGSSAVDRHVLLTRAVMRQYGDRVAMSHQSAAVRQGGPTWGLDLDQVHITHLVGNGRREAGVVHHHRACRVDDLTRVDDHWITSPARTAVDVAAGAASTEAAVVVLSDFLHRGLVLPEELRRQRSAQERWAGTLRLRSALGLADGRLESVAEARCWYLFWRAGLPTPIPQYEVLDVDGASLGCVDFALPKHRVLVEVDGREKYVRYARPGESVADVLLRERRREARIMERTGWILIRLTWWDLEHPEATVKRLLRAINRAS